jgi:hypothetical protein
MVVLSFAAAEHPAFGEEMPGTRKYSGISPDFGAPGSGPPPGPGRSSNVLMQSPDFDPSEPRGRPVPPESGIRTITDIKIADDDFGIYNGSDQSLEFSLSQTPGLITLKSHHLKTFSLAGGTTVTAIIETKGVGKSVTPMQAGTLYVIEASGGRWVFSKF